jgi:hypothetical protein
VRGRQAGEELDDDAPGEGPIEREDWIGAGSAPQTDAEVSLSVPEAVPSLGGGMTDPAVALAAVGLFNVMATMVRRRTRELGVRMA